MFGPIYIKVYLNAHMGALSQDYSTWNWIQQCSICYHVSLNPRFFTRLPGCGYLGNMTATWYTLMNLDLVCSYNVGGRAQIIMMIKPCAITCWLLIGPVERCNESRNSTVQSEEESYRYVYKDCMHL